MCVSFFVVFVTEYSEKQAARNTKARNKIVGYVFKTCIYEIWWIEIRNQMLFEANQIFQINEDVKVCAFTNLT